ncbi:cytochrome c oxidase assembly protein [Brevibacterium sp. VCM10]|uniref:cytochrome c oxidase assembly protein n=1 Tax=Brevibacterium sp. VCM10 TaxID=1381751 RepID=UPI0004B72C32|nr:cytochrome c oxidase assembly protein [Brevibacterium sp. VCM10]
MAVHEQEMSGVMWHPSLPPTFSRVIDWHPQPIPIIVILAAVGLLVYSFCVWLLHRRGVRWPVSRLIWWCSGIVTVILVDGTALNGYGMELFSMHMIQHMILSMLSPILLVLGAPITLMLRVLPAGSGRWNLRRIILAVVHSRPMRVLTNPFVTTALFLMSLYGLYFTPIFDRLMSTMWGHNLMFIHFVAIGMLYFWNIFGVDPSPRTDGKRRLGIDPTVVQVFEVVATVPFHAFFGIVVMMSSTLLTGYYGMAPWGIDPLDDQFVGGGIAWAFTEIPTLIMLGVLIIQWQRSDERLSRRIDRQAARDGDAQLQAYNRYLAQLHAADQRSPRRRS